MEDRISRAVNDIKRDAERAYVEAVANVLMEALRYLNDERQQSPRQFCRHLAQYLVDDDDGTDDAILTGIST